MKIMLKKRGVSFFIHTVAFSTLCLTIVPLAMAQVNAQVETVDVPDAVDLKLDKRVFSPVEVTLLQELEEKRIGLERKERALELRERLLDLSEKKLAEKVGNMQLLKSELETLLRNLSEKEEEELMALAKIYEEMKPASAADVLNRMDSKIVFDLFKRMSRKSTAKIMEKMATGKARVISEMLAEKSDLPAFK